MVFPCRQIQANQQLPHGMKRTSYRREEAFPHVSRSSSGLAEARPKAHCQFRPSQAGSRRSPTSNRSFASCHFTRLLRALVGNLAVGVERERTYGMAAGLSHRRPKIIVDQVPPESIRAAAHDIACRAPEVHVLAVGTCAIN